MSRTTPTLEQMQASALRTTLGDLIKDGSEPAANYAGVDAADLAKTDDPDITRALNKQVLAYRLWDDKDHNLFIEVEDNGDYGLVLGNYEKIVPKAELATLEQELYDWGVAESADL